MIAGSNLEYILTSGQFAVTGELGPPKNGDRNVVRKKAQILKGHVDAVNITDCQTAIVRMSSLTAGLIALSEGLEPVMQMTCRDRNRIGMQADILGASALGIKNLLCLTGDHQRFGNHPQSKGVFDMDSIQLLGMVRGMRDDARFQCGEEIKGMAPRLFLGAAANPFADPFEFRPKRLAKKVAAGANFIQTQIIYNVDKFARFMEMVRDMGLHEKVYILAGVTPPKSLGMAKYMRNNVPGLDVTDDVIERLKGAKDQREEGINIAVDIIRQVRGIPGVAGCHIMAIEWEEAVPEIVKRAGLGPRPEARGVEPVLVGQEAIEIALNRGRDEAGAVMKSEIEKAKAEAQASRDLIVVEKNKANAELMNLKKELEKAMANQKELEARAARLELEKEEAAKQAVLVGPAIGSERSAPSGMAGPSLSSREQAILRSIDLGLAALRKALGLTEEQFEAIKHFMEAEFMFHVGGDVCVQPTPSPSVVSAQPVSSAAPPKAIAAEVEDSKPIVRLIAKGNVLLQKKDINGAIEAFKEALAIDPTNQKATEGLKKAEALAAAEKAAVSAGAACDIPPRPDIFTEEEWISKLVIRLVGKGNVLLEKGDCKGAKECFVKALELKAGDEKALNGLKRAESGQAPVRKEAVTDAETVQVQVPAAQPSPSGPPPEKEVVTQPKKEDVAPTARTEAAPAPARPVLKDQAAVGVQQIAPLPKEGLSLAERSKGISQDLFVEKLSSSIREVTIGDGDKAITVGGETALPFHLFEGDMPNPPRVAFEVLDVQPEDWPGCLSGYYKDVLNDPVAWARKCVNEYGAKAICLSLVSTDPNGLNRPSAEAAGVAKSVIDGVDVPVVLWGCGNAEKDTETLREVTSLIGSKKVCIAPLTDANYRNLGATAMAFGLPVVASTPIDVNLAKQLNILFENLGVSLNQILMDPSIGAVGYGLEYTYSVMERIRLAALTQQDDKLQVPFICNLGREVWKAKETRMPSDPLYGDQEKRGILMEAVTASILMLAGGELMIMRHPRAVSLIETLVQGMM